MDPKPQTPSPSPTSSALPGASRGSRTAIIIVGGIVLVVGAYLFLRSDTTETVVARPKKKLYESANAAMLKEGKVHVAQLDSGTLKGEAEGADAEVRIISIDDNRSTLTVSARKFFGLFPAPGAASDLSGKIIEGANK